jgi:hypothetical protein
MMSHVLICLTKTEHGALHLSELTNMDKFIDLATLCNFCILSNVLDFWTYNFDNIPYGCTTNAMHLAQRQQHDYNALSPGNRIHFLYICGLPINLIHWVNCKYVFEDEGRHCNDFITLTQTYLHQQVQAILDYKQQAEKENICGIPNCISSDVLHQVELLFGEGMPEFAGLSVTELRDATSLSWDPAFTPVIRKQPLAFKGRSH